MKKTTKISLMSGLVTAGVLLCGVHIANAQTNIDSGYTVLITSEVTIDKESGKGSFSVSGKMDAQTELDVTTTSQNNYKLKCGSQFVDYTLDKQSFHIDNIKSANPKSFNEDFNITLANTNTNYSGPYEDRLIFNIQCHKYTYELDMNSILDGVRECERHNYGTADVYINGVLKAKNTSNFEAILNYGDTYEFKNIKATDGHHFVGINSCANTSIKGRIGADTNYLETRRDNPYNLVAPIYFEFNTNKLTINYHADGAQTWKTANINNASEIDVTDKDIMETETLKYDELYSEDAEYQHFCSVSRIKRDGYTAKSNTWKVGQKGSLEVLDYKTLQRAQDVAEYCGVLNQFKKNDLTINLFPIWSADEHSFTIAHWLRLNKAGNGNNDEWKDCYNLGYSSHMIKSDATFIFDSSLAKKIPNGCYLDGDMIIFRDNTSGDYITKSLPYEFTQPAEANSGGQYYYVPYKYQITYDLNGGMENSNKNPSTYTVLDGISLAKPKRIGYTFDGWYDENGNKLTGINEGCTDKFKSIDDVYTQLAKRKTGDIKLTAHWKKYANQYVARFHSNGGQLNIIDDSITNFGNDSNNGFVDVIYTLNASWYWQLGVQANKTGYTCTGYYDAPEGGTKVFDYVYLDNIKQCAGVAVPNTKYFNSGYRWIYENDVELYPHWEAVCSGS
ncbi:InlB B-repeat-containing protein [uncultured Holdemanella sp.]|uniref:InlB B-repeat-containing protein n=1 Tax=uncultured Holdemanella sp. TaxID=1763549 RepID=UPI0025E30667|nr:InlB B-repeat-containing protein [uncultured Holdemanella sp.]